MSKKLKREHLPGFTVRRSAIAVLVILAGSLGSGCVGTSSPGPTVGPVEGPDGAGNPPTPGDGSEDARSNGTSASVNDTDPLDRPPDGEPTTGHRARPHVLVAVPDTGINPYHEAFYRPNRTEHPCTYIEDFPCDIPPLNLSVGMDSYEEAIERDADVLENVDRHEWYWIPKTPFVAVTCDPDAASYGHCLIGEPQIGLASSPDHGVGTTYSVISEAPNASLAFWAGDYAHRPFLERGLPVDIMSVSWGYVVPLPVPPVATDVCSDNVPEDIVYVKGAGNTPWSTTMTCWSGHPDVISVGGAYAGDDRDSEDPFATKQPDVVSYFCRPVARGATTNGTDDRCGTSFAAPTVAGALARVVLEIRRHTGYPGGLDNGTLDPRLDLTTADLRAALNRTATYDPDDRFGESYPWEVPKNEQAPWLQWSWGFYDRWVVPATVRHLVGEPAPAKPEAARLYMEQVHEIRKTVYG